MSDHHWFMSDATSEEAEPTPGCRRHSSPGKLASGQSMVSRTERARAPAMGLERFVDMCVVLGRLFPLGACPHDHECGWQPIRPVPPMDESAGYIEFLLGQAGET